MATLSTLGQMMLNLDPGIKPYSEAELTANRIQGGQINTHTGLLTLADLKRQQEAEAQVMQAIQQNPALAQQLFGGGPVLGALGPPSPGAGGGPMTQTTTRPGQPPGAPQVVPGGQDLSQFASQGTPQSTLGALGPQPQAPQNPLLEMAQRDPRAAFLLQKQLLGQEDLQVKRQEQRLTMGTKVLEHVGRLAQGVTDQGSLDAMRSDLISQGLGKYAAPLPQTYRKEAMAPFIATALDVKEAMALQVQDLQAQAAVIKARKEGRSTDVDNQLRAMGVQPGQETPQQMREALQAVQEGKIAVSASHGTGQLVQTPQGIVRVNPRTGNVDPVEAPGGGPMYPKPTAEEQRAASYGDRAKAAHDNAVALEEKGLTPGIWSKVGEALPFGLGNYLVGEDQQRYRQTVNQFAQAILRKESGAAISSTEYTMTERTYFPQPGDSKKVIDQKRQERERVIQSMQEEGKQTGRTGTQGQPQASGSGASQAPLKPVGEMSRDELLAERDQLRKGGS